VAKKRVIDFRKTLGLYWSLVRENLLFAILLAVAVVFIQTSIAAESFFFKLIIDAGEEYIGGTIGKDILVDTLLSIAAIAAGYFSIKVLVVWARHELLTRFEISMIYSLNRRLFNHIVRLSTSFHNNSKTGALISRFHRSSSAVEGLSDVFYFTIIPLIGQFVVVLGGIAYYDVNSALVLIVMSIIFVLFAWKVNMYKQVAHLDYLRVDDREKSNLADMFINIESIKYYGKEQAIINRYKHLSEDSRKARFIDWDWYKVLGVGQNVILTIGMFLLLLFPLLKFINGEITIGTVVFIYGLYGPFTVPLRQFQRGIRRFYRNAAFLQATANYFDMEQEVKNSPRASKLKVTKGAITFDDVTFTYKKRQVLKNFSLKIKPNTKIALVGPSGAGKSTIIKTLYRLYDLPKGTISIDGKNISKVKQESLRSELSIVPQDCVLFDDTIYNNILFSRPTATRKEVIAAMKFSQLDKVVKEFPQKENTIVGERGVKLSGGEKQRVSIARAILADRKILVLDEATSALDSETEHEIQKSLKKLMKGRTTIIIAHRLSTIMMADEIVVMNKGTVVQQGPHKKLIREKGMYKRLWNLQKGGYIK
jgi:ATP-binding cassette, subfamily B, heavy metal transporter